jgi:hypothetical protein
MHLAPSPCCDLTASYLSLTLTCSLSLLCLLPFSCFDCLTLTAVCFFIVTSPCPLLWLIPVLCCDWYLWFTVPAECPFLCSLCSLSFNLTAFVYALFLSVSTLYSCRCLRSVPVAVYALFLSVFMLCSCWCLRSVLVGVYALFLSVSMFCSCQCLRSVLVGVCSV